MLEVEVICHAVDLLAGDESLDAFGMFCDIDRRLHLIGGMERENHLWRGVYVFLHRHLCLRVFVADFDAEDVAEQIGDFVVMRLCDVALMELRFFLRQSCQRFVKNRLQRPACITLPNAVIRHHHHLIGVTRRYRGEQTGTSATTSVFCRVVTGGEDARCN